MDWDALWNEIEGLYDRIRNEKDGDGNHDAPLDAVLDHLSAIEGVAERESPSMTERPRPRLS